MNVDDFFDKSGSGRNAGFGPRSFGYPTDPRSFTPPEVSEPPSSTKPVAAFFAGLASIVLLSLTEGTLAWVVFESLEDLGFIDRRLPWNPFVIIAFAVNLIRVFDRAAYGRK